MRFPCVCPCVCCVCVVLLGLAGISGLPRSPLVLSIPLEEGMVCPPSSPNNKEHRDLVGLGLLAAPLPRTPCLPPEGSSTFVSWARLRLTWGVIGGANWVELACVCVSSGCARVVLHKYGGVLRLIQSYVSLLLSLCLSLSLCLWSLFRHFPDACVRACIAAVCLSVCRLPVSCLR